MSDEMCGREDAAQDAEACAEALESLDRIALDELFSDSAVDTQDEAHEDSDAKDAPDEAEAEEDDSKDDDQPESDSGEETVLLAPSACS